MLNFDPQGHDPGRVMILYESPSSKVHIYQCLHFYHKVNDLAKIWSLSAGLLIVCLILAIGELKFALEVGCLCDLIFDVGGKRN